MFCRLTLAACGIVLCALVPPADAEATTKRPNVLLLVSDDQRPDTIHALGNSTIRTPHLDRLVEEGTTFTRAITAVPICVASRAEILTGRDGLHNGRDDYGFGVRTGVPSLSEVLLRAGYDTCYVGKWHTAGRPSQYGYASVEGLFAGGAGRLPLTHPVDWKGMPVTGYRGWIFQTDDRQLFPERGVGLTPGISAMIADAALRFLQKKRDAPFFLHVNFTAPHDPLLTPSGNDPVYDPADIPLPRNFAASHPFDHGNFEGRDELLFHWPRTPEETRGAWAVYFAVLSDLDAQLGRLLEGLSVLGQLDNTLIIWTSDHGLALGSHGLRGKQNMYDHSIGVPLIWRGPGITPGRRIVAQCYLRDLYPTICDLCGVEIVSSVQGKSLLPVLDGRQSGVYDAVFAHFRDSQRMIRTEHWKLIVYPLANRRQLFHITEDPDELRNLGGDQRYGMITAELDQRLSDWRRSWNDPTLSRVLP